MLQTIFRATILNFLIFPLWWYSRGLFVVLGGSFHSIKEQQRNLALDIWLKNIFVPMYGQYDIAGRIISFFMRLAQIIGRSVALAVWTVIVAAGIGLWLVLPVVIAYHIAFNLRWL